MVLQSFSIPLGDFLSASSDLDLGRLKEIRLVFDRSVSGSVVLDQVGFSRMDEAFLRASGSGGGR
jgi:hypothetical protein